jgi:hypothetical protein
MTRGRSEVSSIRVAEGRRELAMTGSSGRNADALEN